MCLWQYLQSCISHLALTKSWCDLHEIFIELTRTWISCEYLFCTLCLSSCNHCNVCFFASMRSLQVCNPLQVHLTTVTSAPYNCNNNVLTQTFIKTSKACIGSYDVNELWHFIGLTNQIVPCVCVYQTHCVSMAILASFILLWQKVSNLPGIVIELTRTWISREYLFFLYFVSYPVAISLGVNICFLASMRSLQVYNPLQVHLTTVML